MRRRALTILTALGMICALILPGTASAHGGHHLSATLSGASEVPGPGDPDGVGATALSLNPGHGRVCFRFHVSGITLPATAAHIHQGPAGVAGPIVVTLTPPDATGNSAGCTFASREVVVEIIRNPSAYYVNVHTTDYPGGAVRGQLGRGAGGTSGRATFSTSLTGGNEVPGPGDPDGTGSAFITVFADRTGLCFRIHVSNIALPATAAHIHQGASGIAGPIVVTLAAPDASGVSSGCLLGLSTDLLGAIVANPSGYYVNVHTTDFPGGAVRGQLSQSGDGCDDDGDDGHHGDGHHGDGHDGDDHDGDGHHGRGDDDDPHHGDCEDD
jgi:CHRD domain-containing protein